MTDNATPSNSPDRVGNADADALFARTIEGLESDNVSATERLITSSRQAQEEGHRFLLLVGTILSLALPGAAAASLIHTGWLRWSATWFAACLATKVVTLRISEYHVLWIVSRRTAFKHSLIKSLTSAGSITDRASAFVAAHADWAAWSEKLPKRSIAGGLLIDFAVYGAFLAGVYCLCGGLTDVAPRTEP